MMAPISVIIPTYNRTRWLGEAIDSVLAQTYPQDLIEIILVNDGSTDPTYGDILKLYKDRIIYVEKENGGPASAINKGLEIASGQFIQQLDDDDLLMPEKFSLQVRMFQENPSLGMVGSSCLVIDENGKVKALRRAPDSTKYGAPLTLLRHSIFTQPAVLVKREVYDKVGLYRTEYASDYDMWIRIARYFPVGVIKRPLGKYRIHGTNRSRNSSNRASKVIAQFVQEAIETIPIDELFPRITSLAHAYAVRGAILIRHRLYEKASEEFDKALELKTEPLFWFWLGTLCRWQAEYKRSIEYFTRIPFAHPLYSSAQNAIGLTYKMSAMKKGEDVPQKLLVALSKEYSTLMNITLDLAI